MPCCALLSVYSRLNMSKLPYTRMLLALLGLSLLTAPVHAQTGGILPLASVGEKWPQAIETYVIVVPPSQAGKPVGLQVYSPNLNLADYADGRRSAGYFGDELYKKNEPFKTVFTLSGPSGTVFNKEFGPSREHSWESLWSGGLPAGTYTLKVDSEGDGKNSFALRVAAPFNLQTSSFTVNARDTQQQDLLAARLTVPADWVGKTLSITNYDIDGPTEAVTWVIQPGGKRVDLPSSGNGKYETLSFPITKALLGEWTVYIKVLPTTKQYSNAVTYSFKLNSKPIAARIGGFDAPANTKITNELLVDVVDPQGRPIPGASYFVGVDNVVRPNLPGGWIPVSAKVLEGKGSVISPTELRFTPGSNKLRFVARPPAGGLQVDSVAIYGNQRLVLKGVPFVLEGKNYATPVTVPLAPGNYTVDPTTIPGSSFNKPPVGIVTDGTTGKVTIEYTPRTEVSLLTTPDVLSPCDVTQLSATAKTDFPYKLPADLAINLPSGWTSDYPLSVHGDLSADSPLKLKLPVRVCRSDSAEAVLKQLNLRTVGQATVRSPGGSNVSRNVQQGARASVRKSLEATDQGYLVTLNFSVDSNVDNFTIVDPLPRDGNDALVRGNIKVSGPSLADLQPQVSGDTITLRRTIPGNYTLSYTLLTHLSAERVLTAPDVRW